MAMVFQMQLDEGVRLDRDRVAALYARFGSRRAERIISDAVDELTIRLVDMQRFADSRKPASLRRSAEHLVETARNVGMTTLVQVTADVLASIAAGDGRALEATLARLVRVGNRSLSGVWDLRDVRV